MRKFELKQGNFFYDFKRYFPLLSNLVAKDFKVKYRRSALGIAWSVLNPLLTMIVLTSVFGMLLKIQIPNFASYYIVGYSIWTFFCEATQGSLNSVLGSAALIKKVYIPKYIFPLEKCLFALVNFSFTLVAVLVVMLVQGVYPTITALLFPIPVIYCFIFVCGVSLFLSAANVYFRDIEHLYGVLLTMWMYLTPIIYPMEILEGHALVSKIVELNPLTHYVQYFRDVIMYSTVPSMQENLICAGMSLGVFIIGALVFKKAESKFILHI